MFGRSSRPDTVSNQILYAPRNGDWKAKHGLTKATGQRNRFRTLCEPEGIRRELPYGVLSWRIELLKNEEGLREAAFCQFETRPARHGLECPLVTGDVMGDHEAIR